MKNFLRISLMCISAFFFVITACKKKDLSTNPVAKNTSSGTAASGTTTSTSASTTSTGLIYGPSLKERYVGKYKCWLEQSVRTRGDRTESKFQTEGEIIIKNGSDTLYFTISALSFEFVLVNETFFDIYYRASFGTSGDLGNGYFSSNFEGISFSGCLYYSPGGDSYFTCNGTKIK